MAVLIGKVFSLFEFNRNNTEMDFNRRPGVGHQFAPLGGNRKLQYWNST